MNYLLTGITAYALLNEPIERGPGLVKTYVASERSICEGKIRLRPVLVPFDEVDTEHGWQEEGDEDYSAIAHISSLYLVKMGKSISGEKVIDSIRAARALFQYSTPESIALLPLPGRLIQRDGVLHVEDIVDYLMWKDPERWAQPHPKWWFMERSYSGYRIDKQTWTLLPIFLNDERLLYATLFLSSSEEHRAFLGDDMLETLLHSKEAPLNTYEAVKIENAVHNAYKVVEAIYGGELTKDERKLRAKLQSLGIDPDEQVGYEYHGLHKRDAILSKIEKLREARDDRAAHGRIHSNRKNTFYELMDYQGLARTLILMRIRHLYPDIEL